MGVLASIVVFAIGAILDFAVTVTSPNFNINTVGVILMAAGAVGFVISLFFWASWGGFGGGGMGMHRRVYRQEVTNPGYGPNSGYGQPGYGPNANPMPQQRVIEEEQYQ